ncbi:MAG: Coenzyme F420 hydrogenase/dehydrogenase, beta subunit C-terminal domain [Lachnospiraceae bacterium]|nr:Coenzyme F420 hydrogenase/dehydrogenase, beta subunit C-terminal domain [Lachnospiraceae bacterium]
MDLIIDKGKCCGCSACMSICPKDAITMQPDKEGFLYPHINDELCVNCGLCKKVCTFQNGYDKEKSAAVPAGYAIKHKDEDIRANSRSGGMFTALSDYVLDTLGGVVYGAGYGDHFKVIHKCAHTKEERNEFRGSKYVQSDMNGCFREIKEHLKNNETVLFSGTACQTAALRQYCGEKLEKNLYLVDIVCHGVPSPMIWQDFLKMREKEFHGKIEKVNFRNKLQFGWNAHHETIVIKGNELSSRIFAKLFSKAAIYRPSCYQCIYTNKQRPSDVTLADFWGHEKAVPGFHTDNKGLSLVLGNTEKGRKWIESVLDKVDYIDVTGYPYRHTNMKRPTTRPENREQVWAEYFDKGFVYVAKKYADHEYKSYASHTMEAFLEKLGFSKKKKKTKKGSEKTKESTLKCFTKKTLQKLGLFNFAKKIYKHFK